jgi:hypothetical protein
MNEFSASPIPPAFVELRDVSLSYGEDADSIFAANGW